MALASAFDKPKAALVVPLVNPVDIISKAPELEDNPISSAGTKRSAPNSDANPKPSKLKKGDKVKKSTKKSSRVSAAKKEDPERLERTVFVGNVPLNIEKDKVETFFKEFVRSHANFESALKAVLSNNSNETATSGDEKEPSESDKKQKIVKIVESVRFRSVPIAPTPVAPGSSFRTMIKAAVVTGKVGPTETEGKQSNKTCGRDSMNAYVVFKHVQFQKLALDANGKELGGKIIRVDDAAGDGHFDHKRTVFLGNLPFSVTEDQIRQLFVGKIEGGHSAIEGIRVVRDKTKQIGKGIALVLFKERTSVVEALGLRGIKIGEREVRITRATADGVAKEKGGSKKLSGKKRALPKFMGARAEGKTVKKPVKKTVKKPHKK